jgi:hypothetical protein
VEETILLRSDIRQVRKNFSKWAEEWTKRSLGVHSETLWRKYLEQWRGQRCTDLEQKKKGKMEGDLVDWDEQIESVKQSIPSWLERSTAGYKAYCHQQNGLFQSFTDAATKARDRILGKSDEIPEF